LGAWTRRGGGGVRDFFATSAAIVAAASVGAPPAGQGHMLRDDPYQEDSMSWLDKLLGRGKKATGDMMGDSSMKREGMAEERADMHEQEAMPDREAPAEQRAEREDM
jgi:hypothetical protein